MMDDQEYQALIEWLLMPRPYNNPETFYTRKGSYPYGYPYYVTAD